MQANKDAFVDATQAMAKQLETLAAHNGSNYTAPYGTFIVINNGMVGVGTKVVSDHYGYFTPVEVLDIDLARKVVKLPVQAGFTRTWEIPTKDFAQYFTIYHPVQTP